MRLKRRTRNGRDVELTQIKGLGPAKVEALKAAGITTVEKLANLDLRKNVEVDGVSKESLKDYKQRAKQSLRTQATKAGKSAAKAGARGTKAGTKTTTKAGAKATGGKAAASRSPAGTTRKASTPAATAPKEPATNGATANGAVKTASTSHGSASTTAHAQDGTARRRGWLRRLLRRA